MPSLRLMPIDEWIKLIPRRLIGMNTASLSFGFHSQKCDKLFLSPATPYMQTTGELVWDLHQTLKPH